MPFRQQVFAIVISVGILALIIELVRKRRLREEYSVLWILTGITILVLSLRFSLLHALTRFIGVTLPVSTLFFFGLVFLVLVSLQFSVKISGLANQVQELAQRLALLEVKYPERAPSADVSGQRGRD
jgi:hypothetical protein